MRSFLSLFFLVASVSGFCQNENSLLWKISGNGLKSPSYLFGTIHAIPKDDFFIPKNLIASFLECKSIVLETGLELTVSDSSLKKEVRMPEGYTLKDLYRRRDYKLIQQYFSDSLNGSIKNVLNIKPMWILSTISTRWLRNYVAYESMFISKAGENKKPVLGLETTSDQLALFNQVPLKQQALILLNSIKDRNKEQQNYTTALKAYLAQDIDQLNIEIHSQFKKYPKYYDIFFTGRNASWVTKIDRFIRDHSCFIAVGAGHLGGDEGLVIKLRRMGYIIDPL